MRSNRWALLFFGLVILSPIGSLFRFVGKEVPVDPGLVSDALVNSLGVTVSVVSLSSFLGLSFALLFTFFEFPLRRLFSRLLLLPLAFPAYVVAFLYLGEFLPPWLSQVVVMQGEPWFLVAILSLALFPYIYFFCSLGLNKTCQTEWDTEKILGAGTWSFFRHCLLPKVFPFLISGQMLVLFECLSDFGAASMVNVPVMTTLIYKSWFDLFSFPSAVAISLKLLFVVSFFLIIESFIKSKTDLKTVKPSQPLRREPLPVLFYFPAYLLLSFVLFFGLLFPIYQILGWTWEGLQWSLFVETLEALALTLSLAVGATLLVLISSVVISLWLRSQKASLNGWMGLSTVGYSLPGSVLAVGVYGLSLVFFPRVSVMLSLTLLVLALAHKFLTIGFRPIGDTVMSWSANLDEMSDLLSVSFRRKWSHFHWPSLKPTLALASFLITIEVMKEMPLTLMLAPSGYQTLSIKIFNFTSEGEWEKAALPGLMLILVGFCSVSLMQNQGEKI
ncbi:MAG: ABC transporter permease subunit [Pseudomonadota bacterium]